MAKSLQEQLLQAGLVDKNKAKKTKSDQRKQSRQKRKNKIDIVNESKQIAKQKKAEKAAKDLELNRQQQQQKEQKAIAAQITQLIGEHRLSQDQEGDAFNFNDKGKIKTIYISETMRGQITQGKLAIVKQQNQYVVVPAEIARKISGVNEKLLIVLNDQNQEKSNSEDPYAKYEVPDDLLW